VELSKIEYLELSNGRFTAHDEAAAPLMNPDGAVMTLAPLYEQLEIETECGRCHVVFKPSNGAAQVHASRDDFLCPRCTAVLSAAWHARPRR